MDLDKLYEEVNEDWKSLVQTAKAKAGPAMAQYGKGVLSRAYNDAGGVRNIARTVLSAGIDATGFGGGDIGDTVAGYLIPETDKKSVEGLIGAFDLIGINLPSDPTKRVRLEKRIAGNLGALDSAQKDAIKNDPGFFAFSLFLITTGMANKTLTNTYVDTRSTITGWSSQNASKGKAPRGIFRDCVDNIPGTSQISSLSRILNLTWTKDNKGNKTHEEIVRGNAFIERAVYHHLLTVTKVSVNPKDSKDKIEAPKNLNSLLADLLSMGLPTLTLNI